MFSHLEKGKKKIRICSHLDQTAKKNHLCLHRPAPRWASVSPSEFPPVGMGNCGRSPKWHSFGSALPWEIIRVGRIKTAHQRRQYWNVVSYLQPSEQISFGSKPKRTWPGKLGSNSVADHFKWSEEMHLVLMRWARNRYIIQQYSKNIPRKATANKNKIPHAIL